MRRCTSWPGSRCAHLVETPYELCILLQLVRRVTELIKSLVRVLTKHLKAHVFLAQGIQ